MLIQLVTGPIAYIVMGLIFIIGLVMKMQENACYNEIIRDIPNVRTTTNPLLRQIRTRFEGSQMVESEIKNTGAMVRKYLIRYKKGTFTLEKLNLVHIRTVLLDTVVGVLTATCAVFEKEELNVIWQLFLTGLLFSFTSMYISKLIDTESKKQAVIIELVDVFDNRRSKRKNEVPKEEPPTAPKMAEDNDLFAKNDTYDEKIIGDIINEYIR